MCDKAKGNYCERWSRWCEELKEDGSCPGCVLDLDDPVYIPFFDDYDIREEAADYLEERRAIYGSEIL